jgi:hypothetical protein
MTCPEHLRRLDPADAERLFVDQSWLTAVVVVSVYGLRGVLLQRAEDVVTVQAAVNRSRPFTETELQAADEMDADRRPNVEEPDWYPSQYRDPIARRMAIECTEAVKAGRYHRARIPS